jgi:hypothetical protein
MTSTNVFGPSVSGATVERRIAEFVEPFLNDYIAEAERIDGWATGEIERPLSVVPASNLDRWPEDQLPVLVVVSPGITGTPERRGDGSYRAVFGVQFAPVVSADTEANTRRLAQAHALAMRLLVVQHGGLGGIASDVRWIGESYDAIPFEQTRTLQAGLVAFNVGVEAVASEAYGLPEPLPDPQTPGQWPEATVVDTKVDSIAITEAFGA